MEIGVSSNKILRGGSMRGTVTAPGTAKVSFFTFFLSEIELGDIDVDILFWREQQQIADVNYYLSRRRYTIEDSPFP
eukprot:m.147272 g.147272  ORF g.147272 m.147272 type:complete len:77 (-) comp30523_c1_seq1:184-414(-)